MNPLAPWRTSYNNDDARSTDSGTSYYPRPGQGATAAEAGDTLPPLPETLRGKGAVGARPHSRPAYAPPSAAALSDDDEPAGGAAAAVARDAEAAAASSKASLPKKTASSAADAQLAELRARIREDTLACRQVRPGVRRRLGGCAARAGRFRP